MARRLSLTSRTMLFLSLTTLALLAPQAQIFNERQQIQAQIVSLQQSLESHQSQLSRLSKRNDKASIAPEIAWKRTTEIAKIYPQIDIKPTTAPAQETRKQSLWWGRVQGDLLQVLLFARRIDSDPNTQVYSLSHNDNQTTLLFYLFTNTL